MELSHRLRATSAVFDDPNLVSCAGLVPVLALADRAGLRDLADAHLSVPGDQGANARLKVASLVGGMVVGADTIDDMAVLRHGAMGRLFSKAYAPSTLGSFLRAFGFGHIRQLDALASRFLLGLAKLAGLFSATSEPGDGRAHGYGLIDVDDTVVETTSERPRSPHRRLREHDHSVPGPSTYPAKMTRRCSNAPRARTCHRAP